MLMELNSADKLILALDGMDYSEVFDMVDKLEDLRWVKVGLELFVNAGPEVVSALRDRGLKIFLDLKFHDIPITMAGACRQAARTGAQLITVHACAGMKALRYAKCAADEGAKQAGYSAPTLLAVTVLTSWDAKGFSSELGINQSIEKRVKALGQLAAESGIGGCVCSPLEVKILQGTFPHPFELVTPGIRSKELDLGDQVRVMRPSEALKAGATRLVIGRPITKSSDPHGVFKSICREIDSC